jgi:spermidine synthase
MTSALPYRLRPRPAVLVLGAGGGQDLLQALSLDAHRVDVVEVDPQRLTLLRDTFDAWAGHPYRDHRVRKHVAEPRAWARATRTRYDLIVLGNTDSLTGGGAGAQAASEQYVLTVQAMGDMYARLEPGGLLALTRYAKQPPRDELKLFATAAAALRAQGAGTPAAQLAMIRGWDASTLLVRRGAFEAM